MKLFSITLRSHTVPMFLNSDMTHSKSQVIHISSSNCLLIKAVRLEAELIFSTAANLLCIIQKVVVILTPVMFDCLISHTIVGRCAERGVVVATPVSYVRTSAVLLNMSIRNRMSKCDFKLPPQCE